MIRAMRTLTPAALCAAVLLAAPASAQVAAPGLGLNRPDLEDSFLPPADGRMGVSAEVKGDPGPNGYGSYLEGRILGGVFPHFSTPSGPLNRFSPLYFQISGGTPYSTTLIPPFVSGALLKATSGGNSGDYLKAAIFEPDQIKRKGKNGKFRTQLKQKNHVGIFRGGFSGVNRDVYWSYGSPWAIGTVPGCKAQADIRDEPGFLKARFKVSCSGKDPESLQVQEEIADFFEKKRKGFDLEVFIN